MISPHLDFILFVTFPSRLWLALLAKGGLFQNATKSDGAHRLTQVLPADYYLPQKTSFCRYCRSAAVFVWPALTNNNRSPSIAESCFELIWLVWHRPALCWCRRSRNWTTDVRPMARRSAANKSPPLYSDFPIFLFVYLDWKSSIIIIIVSFFIWRFSELGPIKRRQTNRFCCFKKRKATDNNAYILYNFCMDYKIKMLCNSSIFGLLIRKLIGSPCWANLANRISK